jgi:DNA polymerase III sliding clamp (beta) subunit (PCNA family)
MTMVVTLTKRQLNEIAKTLGQVMPRKPKVAVLGHVLFETSEGGRLQVAATDLEQTLTVHTVPENLEGASGRFLLPIKELRTLAKSLPRGGKVTLQPLSETSVVCTMEANGQPVPRTVATMPVSEFPDTSVQAEMADCDLGAFLLAYRQAAFAAHSDKGRLVLHAVYADHENKVLVGTDGHRLTRSAMAAFPFGGDAILPLNKVLLKHFPEEEQGRIGMHEEDGVQTLVIATDEMTYSCRCPDGTFPNYRQVIPDMDGFATSLRFGEADVESVRSLVPFLDKDLDNTLCVFGESGKAAVAMEDGEDTTILPLAECQFEGEELGICINGKFLLEALEHGFVSMRVRNGQTPLVFDDGNDGLHLLMPLRREPSEALRNAAGVHLGEVSQHADNTPTEPAPTIAEETSPMPKPEATAPTTQQPTRNMQFVQDDEAEAPVVRLEELVNETQELVKQANASIREVKKQLRTVKTHFRDREKQIGSREKEMEKSLTLIQRLQETIAA